MQHHGYDSPWVLDHDERHTRVTLHADLVREALHECVRDKVKLLRSLFLHALSTNPALVRFLIRSLHARVEQDDQ